LDIPQVDLGNDISLCGGSVDLDAQNSGYSFLWQDNSENQVLTVSQTGTYWVEVANEMCIDRDTIFVSLDGPIVDLGPDIVSCTPSQILDAGNPGATYLWQDNSTASTFAVNDVGTYWVVVDDGNGCTNSDTIVFTLDQIIVDAGNDVIACQGTPVSLEVDYNNAHYLWNTGQVSQSINAMVSGMYSVLVTYGLCTDEDSVQVEFYLPQVEFSADPMTGCPPLEVNFMDLSSSSQGNLVNWVWSSLPPSHSVF